MDVTALVPYFGCARMVAEKIGELLSGCSWVGIPFAGGMPELAYIDARSIAVNDLHWHVINLASVVADDKLRPKMFRWLRGQAFGPPVLEEAQSYCIQVEPAALGDLEAAKQYFASQWMGRSAQAGTDDEFKGGISTRWTDTGGDSNTRYRSAIRSLATFGRIMRRCNFTCMDAFDFLGKCKDRRGHAIYADCPWPKDGDPYRHKFTESDHRKLAGVLSSFRETRVVIRYGDHPLIRELYPEHKWRWQAIEGRTSGNKAKAEVLIVNRANRAESNHGGNLF